MRKLERLLEIVEKSADPVSIAEISRRMYSQQDGFYELLALTDTGSRVEYLEQRGRLAVANLDQLRRDEGAAYRYATVRNDWQQSGDGAGHEENTE